MNMSVYCRNNTRFTQFMWKVYNIYMINMNALSETVKFIEISCADKKIRRCCILIVHLIKTKFVKLGFYFRK